MMKKRGINLLLIVVMLFGLVVTVAACVEPESLDEFTVYVTGAPQAPYTNWDQQPIYQKLEEISGKKVNFVHGTLSEISSLWSGDYVSYDAIMLSETVSEAQYPGGLDKGVADGVLWDLTDIIAEKAPDYLAALEEAPEQISQFTISDSGKRVGIYNLPMTEQGPWMGYVFREDWLNYYNMYRAALMQEPLTTLVTYDDWEGFLKFVKTDSATLLGQSLNGGKAPLYVGSVPDGSFTAGFNVWHDMYLKEGTTAAYGPMQDEYKEYLDKMKSWYDDGLIDASYASENNDITKLLTTAIEFVDPTTATYTPAQYAAFPLPYTYIETFVEKTMHDSGTLLTAMALDPNNAAMADILNGLASIFNGYTLKAVARPVKTVGAELHLGDGATATASVVLTNRVKTRAKAEMIVEWFNYLYSDAGRLLMNYGIEGDTFTYDENEKAVFTEKITNNPDGLNFNEAMNAYLGFNFVFAYEWERELQVVTEKEIAAMNEIWPNDSSYNIPTVTFTETEGRVIEEVYTTIRTYTDEYTANYIMGKTGTPDFATFKDNLITYGVNNMVSAYSSAYERFKTRTP